jgi:hypothetical protein
MIDDYFVLRALYRRRRSLRRLAFAVLVLLFIGALIYAAAFLSAAFERLH